MSTALEVFDRLFADHLDEIKAHPAATAKPRISVIDYPCELSFRTLDDVSSDFSKTVEGPKSREMLDHVRKACNEMDMKSTCFAHVRGDYYDLPLEERQRILSAPGKECLCKSLIMENMQCTKTDCSDPNNSRYYCIIVQYIASINTQKIDNFVRSLTGGSRSHYHFRMASTERAFELSGFEHNAITPVGMRCGKIPIIMAKGLLDIPSNFFWLGGGQVDLKLGFQVDEFVEKFKPFVVDIY